MLIYEIYNCAFNGLSMARIELERELEIVFSERDSMHYGGEYYRWDDGALELKLFNNCDFEGESVVGEVEDTSAIIMSVESTSSEHRFLQRIEQSKLPLSLVLRESE